MKILSCHIENFGKIHDYSMSFCDGENIICEENGWGKSTFVAFIRAMFYGFEGERKKKIEENERMRYKPWQGGVFGGQLEFEIQGKKYLISRVFKDKESNDEFELRDATTNLPVKEYTSKIGEEIFKINRASFLRTVFIEQNQCETSPTDDINAKIGKLADNTGDLNNFEAATEKLTKIINKLTPDRSTGSISKRTNEIAGYERKVKDGEGISDSIQQHQEKLHEEEAARDNLKKQMKEVGEKQKKVSEQQSVMAKKSEWERLNGTVDAKTKEKETCEKKFPGNIPLLEDVKKKISECADMNRAQDRVKMYQVTQEEKDELASLAYTFMQGTPSDADLNEMFDNAKTFDDLNQMYISEQLSPVERKKLDELELYFENESESVNSIVSKWNNRNSRKNALPSKQAALMALRASMDSQRSQRSGKISLLLIAGIILVVAGLIVAIAKSPVAGIAIATAGVGLAVAGILGNKKAEPAQPSISPELENLKRAIEGDEEFVSQIDKEVADYLIAYGRDFNEDTTSVALQDIMAESVEYSSLKKKFEKSLNSTTATDLENLRQSLRTFLGRYRIAPTGSKFVEDLHTLKNKMAKYRELSGRQKNLDEAEGGYKALRTKIVSFLKEYDYEVSDNISLQLDNIRDSIVDYKNSVKALVEAMEELQKFETENMISALNEIAIDASLPTLDTLNQMSQQIATAREDVQRNISCYNQTLEELQKKYDEWQENSMKLEELKSLQAMEKKKYKYVSIAKEKLKQAKKAMTAKYADPIFQSFCKYYEMLSCDAATCFHIDANTTITVDELGKQRDTNTLSYGYRDLIGICLRIALVDAMYQEEKPPLIMDDPFTNLDDKKVNAGMDFIAKLAEKYQIIYFTCNTSRGCTRER